ncbi:hypothetical protein [Opacimonas viscosa]|uniref:Uncharacterized protein n=1 Tax=Opacimonas viscosa TaxID=2961944 RepID=A0AA41WZH6_9ALTE|nr:hypothetical protein [Opacimonas viscosa]MCP3429349.1 hypothetical protein [Opacimonas viscosa]
MAKASQLLHSVLAQWVDKIDIRPFSWNGLPLHVPVYSVYAIIPDPVADHFVYHGDILVPIMKFGKYSIPLIDPSKEGIKHMPKFAVVISYSRDNAFGLFAYPADNIEETYQITYADWDISQGTKPFYL